jgi:S-(hydroxymethyl)glutathione dehydrogenase/alcohol dehydrogenase
MRAAVCHRFGQPPAIEEIDLDPPQHGEVRVDISAVAICHSDVAYSDGAWGGELPAVYGHEACGIVAATGPDVERPAVGDQVVVSLVRHCGRCARCAAGEPALCSASFRLDDESPIRLAGGRRAAQGMRCGAFADAVVVHASQAVALDPQLPAASACLIACAVMTGVGAVVHAAAVTEGSSLVVIGAGGVGLNAVQGGRLAGAGPLIAIDLADAKLAAAHVFGATETLTAGPGTPEAVRELTGGEGADAVVLTAGSAAAIDQGLACLRRGGTLVVAGMPPAGQRASFDPAQLAHDGQRIVGTKMGSADPAREIPRIAGLYRDGGIKLDELVTATYPLERINDAMAAMRAGEALRNVIVM